MKLNENMILHGQRVVLVPYEKHHVEKYHSWMQSPELQESTASEPLTLSEEYTMQKNWREDEDKCTFIILDKEKYDRTNDDVDSMIGDTNLFLDPEEKSTAEIEIMIAEKSARRKRCGLEATMMMLLFGKDHLNIDTYLAKIGQKNTASIEMFQKIGFKEFERSEIFKEVTLKWTLDRNWNYDKIFL